MKRRHTIKLILASMLVMTTACTPEPAPEPDRATWMVEHAADYLRDDPTSRRSWLERGWWSPELSYTKQLKDHYGLPDEGWELLPELNFEIDSLSDAPFEGRPIFNGVTPTDKAGWLELGRIAFWRMPMRRDAYVEWLASKPELWDRFGVERDAKGAARGLVRYRDSRGQVRTGMSCGFCHGEQGLEGKANKSMDLGGARAAFREARGLEPGDFSSWGPGMVDVTDDQVIDPLAIPNLWGASVQDYFNASGSVKIEQPGVAAVRFETQYIINHGYEVRPPRALTWALATYVYSLRPPEHGELELNQSGERVFMARCASCHNPDEGYSGGLVLAESIKSDPQASRSITRGTGSYRVPSLLGVSTGGPYLHDASAPDLEALLTSSGHPYGQAIEDQDRADLIEYLNQL